MEFIIDITGYIGIIIIALLCYAGIPCLFFFLVYQGMIKPFISVFRKRKGGSLPTTEQRR